MNHKRTLSVALTLAFLSILVAGMMPAHAVVPPPWTVSLDANSTNNTDACYGTSSPCTAITASFAKTFYIGAIVNASGVGGVCGATCIRGVYGWQFSIVYDNTSFVPQADPVALSANDLPPATVRLGAQGTIGNPNWDALKTGGAFIGTVILPVDATHQKINVFFSLVAPQTAVNIFPAVSATIRGNLLASVL